MGRRKSSRAIISSTFVQDPSSEVRATTLHATGRSNKHSRAFDPCRKSLFSKNTAGLKKSSKPTHCKILKVDNQSENILRTGLGEHSGCTDM